MRAQGKGGLSMVELLISVVVLGLVMSSVALVGLSNRRAFDQGAGSADLEARARRAVDHVVQELMRAGRDTLDPAPVEGTGASDFTFQKPTGAPAGVTTWSTPFRLRWEYEEGEIDDGIDNNGNGLIDEGRLLYTRAAGEPNEKTIVICHNLAEYLEGEVANNADDNGNGLEDERGFCVERIGDAIVVRITLMSVVADSGLQMRTIETSVKLRN